MSDMSVEHHADGTVTVRTNSMLMQRLLAEHGATTMTFMPEGWVALMGATYGQHDHDDQLRHLVDEWGALGVAVKLLAGVPESERATWLERLASPHPGAGRRIVSDWYPPSEPPTVDGVVTHRCPPRGEWVMPCCGLPPGERLGDRMTVVDDMVTCNRDAIDAEAVWSLGHIYSALFSASSGTSEFVKAMEMLRWHADYATQAAVGPSGRCCERGLFGEDHDCMKQDGAVVDAVFHGEFTDAQAAMVAALTVESLRRFPGTSTTYATKVAAQTVRMARGAERPGWDEDDITAAIDMTTARR